MIVINISCDKQEVFYRFQELKNADWAQNDTLFFDIDSTAFELNVPYKLTIEVTNNVNYPYQNIWLFIQTNIASDSLFTQLQKEYLITDKFGKWVGSGFGSLYQTSFLLDNITFKEKRNYRIKLEHGMRDEPLQGIEKVGIKITK